MSRFNAKRDAETVRELDADHTLMCRASGCPNRWTVDSGAPLCSAHAWCDPVHWPQVTQEQLDAQLDRARRVESAPPSAKRWTHAEKTELLGRLRNSLRQRPPRDWVERLRDRERAGERLTAAQRAMLRDATAQTRATEEDTQ